MPKNKSSVRKHVAESIKIPNISRRGFITAAGTSALSLTALGHVAREARGATLNPDLTMAASEHPDSAYPEWFPSWDRIVDMAKKEGKVQISAWGGPEVKDHYNKLVRSFEKAYGIKADYTHGDWFSAQQQVLGDVENKVTEGKIDAIFLWGKPFSNLLQGNGVWEVPILDLLPNARQIAYRPELGRFVHDMVPTYGTFVPHINWQNCYVYDKSKYKRSDMPNKVTDVLEWAKAHKGEFTYCDFNKGGSGHTFGMMLIYELTGGYEKYAFKPYDPSVADNEWDALWDFLTELEEYCYQSGTYPQGNSAVAQLFSAGEISFCPNWDTVMGGQVKQGFLDPDRLGMYVPEPGIFSPLDGFTIPVNAPNKAAALLFLNHITSVESQANVIVDVGAYPAVTEAWDTAPQSIKDKPWHPEKDLQNWRDLGTVGARHGEYMFRMMQDWIDKVARI
jgi:putative spermidine/putrescine transport system substrate-binding protein